MWTKLVGGFFNKIIYRIAIWPKNLTAMITNQLGLGKKIKLIFEIEKGFKFNH